MLKVTNDVINWIRDYFSGNDDGKAIIGISGGKDSTIVAGLLVKALGADRVIAVMMPNGEQADIRDSLEVCNFLNIPRENSFEVNIFDAFMSIKDEISIGGVHSLLDEHTKKVQNNDIINTNLPSRLRMCTLYTVAALYPNSRVVNTSNYSERYIGYSTKWGDGVGDFSPLGHLTVREVLEIGDDLGLPYHLVHKTPSDGMSGTSDEEKIGFTYDELDKYLLCDGLVAKDVVEKIERLHRMNLHKVQPIPTFYPKGDEE